MNPFELIRRTLLVLGSLLLCLPPASASVLLPPGFRAVPRGVHALAGGKVVISPGEKLESATIIIRDGYIENVGAQVTPPPDARIWDMKGLTVYAGFIEPYLTSRPTNAPPSTSTFEPVTEENLTSRSSTGFYGVTGQRTDAGQPGPGYEVARIAPEYRAVRDYSPDRKRIDPLRELGFTTAVIVPGRGIIRGTSALVSLVEEDPNRIIVKPDVFQHVSLDAREGMERSYPASLMGVIAVTRQSFFDAQHYAQDHADWAKNPRGRMRPVFDPSLEALLPAAEGQVRVVFEPGSVLMVDRVARVARELQLNLAVVSCGEEWRRPELAGGTGARFIVPLNFPKLPRWPAEEDWEQATLDQLRAWDWAPENPAVLRRQNLEIALTTHGLNDRKEFRKNLRLALERGLSEDDALAALTTVPAKLCGVDKQLGTIEAGKIANLTIVDGKGYFDSESRVRELWIDGRNYHVQPAKDIAIKDEAGAADKETKTRADREKREAELKEVQNKRIARLPTEDRGPVTNPPSVLISGATIWTCGSRGVLTNGGNLFCANGRIVFVGAGSGERPTMEIDGRGLHVTPGLIDCHSHSAILGGVNEPTLPSSAMCRIGDVVNSETRNIQDQLAGGLTVANLLHGSANPIGGQNQVIKLRDGDNPEQLKFESAPPGIKFALGENVKQSNAGERAVTRYPQTRMGVPVFYDNRFTAAQQYLSALAEHAKTGGVPPRRDLELEALGEIIQGKRLIHCHSYRQDEILAFLRVMEGFKVRVGTLQHILEGYKVANEIAAHGAGASCFADWWAYKFEVYDAIPFAGTLMHERGVLVSFNSDSSDLARRMNTEAAKAVKFGGLSEIEALKFVTLNPARQLGIDQRVGSLEPGKDADFVIWSGHPLDTRSVVLQTWIDGKKYFDRGVSDQRTAALVKEREDLVAKARKVSRLSRAGPPGGGVEGDDGSFFRIALEHEHDGTDRHCLEEER